MDDFSVYGSSFEDCLRNLETVLQRCQDKNLALNWEKFHFMVTEGIVLGQKIFVVGLEVDQEKIIVIKTFMPSTTVKGIRSFLGHAGFYRRFIKDFSKISRPLSRLLEKDAKFDFDESCKSAFEEIKSRLVSAPIILTPDWGNEFEIMCDASDYAMGVVLGQRTEKIFKVIYYASKTFATLIEEKRLEENCRMSQHFRRLSRHSYSKRVNVYHYIPRLCRDIKPI